MDGLVAGAGPLAGVAPREEPLLPALREDLRLIPAAANHDGSPAWMIHDPVANRFFQIGWFEQAMLARWSLGRASRIVAAIERETPLSARLDDVGAFAQFLRSNQLLRASDAAATRDLAGRAARAKESKLKWLLHNYLFFRIPLVRPQRFLAATAPALAFLFSRWFATFVVLATAVGLVLVARQWDQFVHTFTDLLSLEGLAGYLVALFVVKTCHELGHAYTATRYGVRVAHMGIAFLVLWPMLYTDTSESWRLADRGKRFRIAAAGVAVEFALAGLATLAWSLVADGALKSALFFVATTSWVLTLAINASPFMRFDGYFLLSDALDMPNLHARASAFARAQLRRVLFGWNEPEPEVLRPGLRRFLIAFAYTTWLYRLAVFIGIAIAVYLFFFKLLGIFLFIVEIAWFVARPIWMEMKVWGKRAGEIRFTHALGLLVVAGAFVALFAIPWHTQISAPGWLRASEQQTIYSPVPARLATFKRDGVVAAGDVIATLDSPDTRSKAAQAQILAEALASQLDRAVGRSDGAARRAVFTEELRERVAEWEAQRAELRRLELRAPFAGRILDADPHVARGAWVNAKQPLAMLVADGAWVAEVYVEQQALTRIERGAAVRFYLQGIPSAPIRGEVIAIDTARTLALPHAILAAARGGPIVTVGDEKALIPRDALYRVLVRIDAPPEGGAMRVGTAKIDGRSESLLAQWWRDIVGLAVREAGF